MTLWQTSPAMSKITIKLHPKEVCEALNRKRTKAKAGS